jgi:glutathione S-transferase
MDERMGLALYKYDACGYCQQVLRAIRDLDIEDEVELRDTLIDPKWRKELIGAMGRATVPVLRIEEPADAEDGEPSVRWLPESRDIVAYLYERYGEGKEPPKLDVASVQRVATMAMWALLGAGIFFTEWQAPLWFTACMIGALRSFHNGWRTKGWFHWAIGAVFLFASASILLRAYRIVDLPWWYVAYGLVGLLLVGGLLFRRRLRR